MARKTSTGIQLVLDGNEANVAQRVGVNVYAFEVLKSLEQITRNNSDQKFTILLSSSPEPDLPPEREGWTYKVIKPRVLWTQLTLPAYLFINKNKFDVFFTPSHYAPRLSTVPYVSSIMDLAFLEFPDQFKKTDLVQLQHWTAYSVANAEKIITISNHSKRDIVKHYHRDTKDIVVAYPAASEQLRPPLRSVEQSFFRKNKIKKPYILFVGTIQPRKNLIRLVEAFEQLCRRWELSKNKRTLQKTRNKLPQLVIAGKVGWLADETIERIQRSPFHKQIITPGFIPQPLIAPLYQRAACSVLVGLYEGFGIPALESLLYGCVPVISNSTSLPEVVGKAGIKVNPLDSKAIARGLEKALFLTPTQKARYRKHAREQLAKFSWDQTANTILETLKAVAKN